MKSNYYDVFNKNCASTDSYEIIKRKRCIVVNSKNKKINSYTHDSTLSLLEVLEGNGVEVKSNCRSGFCGQCKVKLNHGVVKSNDHCGLTDAEKKAGYILACCSKPIDNVDISLC